jgi:predicted SprT family Zn-dependent metalloprotease
MEACDLCVFRIKIMCNKPILEFENFSSVNAIKARIRRQMIKLHKLARRYMRIHYNIRYFPLPRLFFRKHPEAWGYADWSENSISIDISALKFPWLVIDEVLPHEMAHMAMYRIRNVTHDKVWKACAMFLGSTSALSYGTPHHKQKQFYGVFSYKKKDGTELKVIGKPFNAQELIEKKFRLKEFVDITFTPFKHAESLQKKLACEVIFNN